MSETPLPTPGAGGDSTSDAGGDSSGKPLGDNSNSSDTAAQYSSISQNLEDDSLTDAATVQPGAHSSISQNSEDDSRTDPATVQPEAQNDPLVAPETPNPPSVQSSIGGPTNIIWKPGDVVW